MGSAEVSPWRRLASRVVFRNEWITVREDEVARPDGRPGSYGVVEVRPSVGVVAVDPADRVALVRQWRYTHSKMSLEIPTGASEDGDTDMAAAARRELAEETGLRARSWQPLGTVDNCNGVTTDVAHLFLAEGLAAGTSAPEGTEAIEVVWCPFQEAVRYALTGDITESVSVAALLKVAALRNQPAGRD